MVAMMLVMMMMLMMMMTLCCCKPAGDHETRETVCNRLCSTIADGRGEHSARKMGSQ